MGKAAKSKRSNDRKKKLRAAKERRKAAYAGYANAGDNSKRARIKAKKGHTIRSVRHKGGPCANVGCSRCNLLAKTLLTPAGSPTRKMMKNTMSLKNFLKHV